MKSLIEQLSLYHSHHTKQATKLTHYIGIPAVIIGVLIFLSWIHIDVADWFSVSFAWLLVLGCLIYYFFLDWQLAFIALVVMLPSTAIISWLSSPSPNKYRLIAFLIFFVGGWILQFIGHAFEKKAPAFMKSLSQLFIAPLFIIAEACIALGYRTDLKQAIEETSEDSSSN